MSGNTSEQPTVNDTDEVESKVKRPAEALVYGKFFGLDDDPFRVTPDPRFMYTGEGRDAVAQRLLEHVRAPAGLTLISGQPGSGKSLILRWLMAQFPPEQPLVMIWHASLMPDDFLDAVCARMEVESASSDASARLAALHDRAATLREQGVIPVVLVDEGNSLRPEVLALVGALLGGTDGKDPAVSVVVGVDAGARERFVQAVGVPVGFEWKLDALTPDEVADYVCHRVNMAGGDGSYLFKAEALDRIALLSGGVPRVINTLCGKSLLLTYLGDEHQITARAVDEAGRELWVGDETLAAAAKPSGSTLPERIARGRACQTPSPDGAAADEAPIPPPAPVQAAAADTPRERVGQVVVAARDERWNRLGSSTRSDAANEVPGDVIRRPLVYRPGIFGILAIIILIGSVLMAFGPGRRLIERAVQPAVELVRGQSAPIIGRYETLGIGTPEPAEQSMRAPGRIELRGIDENEPALSSPPSLARTFKPSSDTAPRVDTRPGRLAPESFPGAVAEDDLADPGEQRERRVKALLVEAVRHVNARRFVAPTGRNALDAYRHVLEIDPDNQAAQAGIRSIRDRFVRWARVAESRDDWVAARDYYRVAMQVGPMSQELEKAMARVQANSP